MVIMAKKTVKTKVTYIVEKMSSEESVNSQELEETPQIKKHTCITHLPCIHPTNGLTSKQAAALFPPVMNSYFYKFVSCKSAYIFTRKEPGTSCLGNFACKTAGEISTITNFCGHLTM